MGFLGTIGKALGGAVGGLLKGGPVGAITGAIGGIVAANKPGTAVVQRPVISSPISTPNIAPAFIGGKQGPNLPSSFPGAVPEPGFKGGLQRLLPGGQSGFTGAPPGYHINRAYMRHLVAEANGRQTQNPFNEPRARNVVVKNRSMNPLNPRALKRANSRQKAAVRMMRGALKGSGYVISRSAFRLKKGKR